jgi:hypothetical protein
VNFWIVAKRKFWGILKRKLPKNGKQIAKVLET